MNVVVDECPASMGSKISFVVHINFDIQDNDSMKKHDSKWHVDNV